MPSSGAIPSPNSLDTHATTHPSTYGTSACHPTFSVSVDSAGCSPRQRAIQPPISTPSSGGMSTHAQQAQVAPLLADQREHVISVLDAVHTRTPLRKDTTPGEPTHLDTVAGAARVLLENVPADDRGPRLREDAREIAAALDRRNGNGVQSELLRERFFPEG